MEKNKIKWGIIGPGWIAHKFATALQVAANCELYAVGSRHIDTAKKFAAEFHIPKSVRQLSRTFAGSRCRCRVYRHTA